MEFFLAAGAVLLGRAGAAGSLSSVTCDVVSMPKAMALPPVPVKNQNSDTGAM